MHTYSKYTQELFSYQWNKVHGNKYRVMQSNIIQDMNQLFGAKWHSYTGEQGDHKVKNRTYILPGIYTTQPIID